MQSDEPRRLRPRQVFSVRHKIMTITLCMLAVAIGYRVLLLCRRTLAFSQRPPANNGQNEKGETPDARIAAILSLVSVPIVGVIAVGYGMGMAMSDGASVAHGREIFLRAIVYLPALLGSFAVARSRSKLTLVLALPSLAIYFWPPLQKNLGL